MNPYQRLKEILKDEFEKGELYHPIEHPDFNLPVRGAKGIPPQEERLQAVLEWLRDKGDPYAGVVGKLVLDLGCCLGYCSFKLARMGAYMTGVDHDEKWIEACKCLVNIYHSEGVAGIWSMGVWMPNPSFIHEDIIKFLNQNESFYDFTLCFSVFHHLLGRNPLSAWRSLDKLSHKTPILFLCMDTVGEIRSQDEIPQAILNHSAYTESAKLLVDKTQGRHLYAFWR